MATNLKSEPTRAAFDSSDTPIVLDVLAGGKVLIDASHLYRVQHGEFICNELLTKDEADRAVAFVNELYQCDDAVAICYADFV